MGVFSPITEKSSLGFFFVLGEFFNLDKTNFSNIEVHHFLDSGAAAGIPVIVRFQVVCRGCGLGGNPKVFSFLGRFAWFLRKINIKAPLVLLL